MWKMYIRCWDLKSQPLERKSPPTASRAGLPPIFRKRSRNIFLFAQSWFRQAAVPRPLVGANFCECLLSLEQDTRFRFWGEAREGEQCDQIGPFLNVLGNVFANTKVTKKRLVTFGVIWKRSIYVKPLWILFWKQLGNFLTPSYQ